VSTIKVNNIEPSSAGNETYFLAKAWVNFNGTGTPTARASGNLSSITDNGIGRYTLNLTLGLSDVNYATTAAASRSSTLPAIVGETDAGITKTTSAVQIACITDASAALDPTFVNVSIVR
jgi:hypothetical protein